MNMNHIRGYLFVLGFFTLSCQHPSDNLPCIDTKKHYPEKEILLTDIANVSYLHLNSENDAYLYSGTIKAISESRVVVADMFSGDILFFSKEGEPKSRFNRMGNGPGEYRSAYRMFYDEEPDELFIVQSADSVIKVYSSAGNFLREILFPPKTMIVNDIVSFDEHSFIFYDEGSLVHRVLAGGDLSVIDDIARYYVVSKVDGSIIDVLEFNVAPVFLGIYLKDGTRLPTRSKIRLIKSKDGVLICNPEADTVFMYGKDKSITPVLHKTPLAGSSNPITYLNNCVDGGQNLFVEVYTVRAGNDFPGNFPVDHFMVDKKTGEVSHQNLIMPDYIGKKIIIKPNSSACYEYGYFFELDLLELKQAYAENRLSGKLKELVATLKDDDNNVFVMANFTR